MDSLYPSIYHTLDIHTQVLTAVTHNSTSELHHLLERGAKVNARIQQLGGNTALHIAAKKGHEECLAILLNAGAKGDKTNDLGFTPLYYALLKGYLHCAEMLLGNGDSPRTLTPFWKAKDKQGMPQWLKYTIATKRFLIMATPSVSSLGIEINGWLFSAFLQIPDMFSAVKMYLLTGNRLSHAQLLQVKALCSKEQDAGKKLEWLDNYEQNVLTLQECSRIAIRKHLVPNVVYGAKHLRVPNRVKEYILFKHSQI
ncbi:ankyrin-1 [Lingula anatina]|uniref:Ankyrin-1 n=1 Tax=Lingula anatina TaxID=7574 RepID=A0A1S3HHD8_LINAN|nr:ankyrin-1 [Lingula anatina]|eukprot:XP_013385508.1 ankyrin-1 [Lingula anatina]